MEEKQELIIEWHVDGFMQKAEYCYGLTGFLDLYKSKFPGAEKLIVTIHECSLFELNNPKYSATTTFSEDRKTITIYNEVNKAYDINGKEKGTPTPQSIYQTLSYIMDKAVREYNTLKVVQ
jgi:hypothetical protein